MEARKIIITGGATRIGAAIAKKLSGPNKELVLHFNKSKSKAENLKKKYVIKNCKGGKNPSSEKAKYTLDISKGLYNTVDNGTKAKFFYKISN